MALASEQRRSDRFVGDGSQTAFPFPFKVFALDQVSVMVGNGIDTDEKLDASAYTVTLSTDQDNSPGGTVNLKTPLVGGKVLVILSSIPALQPTVFTNRGGFYPSVLNDSLDRVTALIQQLKEQTERAWVVPVTSSQSPQQLMTQILGGAEKAGEYVKQAEATLKSVLALLDEAKKVRDDAASIVKEEGNTQVGRVKIEGDRQVSRLESVVDFEEALQGVRCMERVWTIDEEVEAESIVELPNSMQYVVGRDHLRLAYNGVVLFKNDSFSEIGDPDTLATTFKINLPLQVGDELMAWTVPLGRGGFSEDVLTRVASLEDAFAELSQKVVYKE